MKNILVCLLVLLCASTAYSKDVWFLEFTQESTIHQVRLEPEVFNQKDDYARVFVLSKTGGKTKMELWVLDIKQSKWFLSGTDRWREVEKDSTQDHLCCILRDHEDNLRLQSRALANGEELLHVMGTNPISLFKGGIPFDFFNTGSLLDALDRAVDFGDFAKERDYTTNK